MYVLLHLYDIRTCMYCATAYTATCVNQTMLGHARTTMEVVLAQHSLTLVHTVKLNCAGLLLTLIMKASVNTEVVLPQDCSA